MGAHKFDFSMCFRHVEVDECNFTRCFYMCRTSEALFYEVFLQRHVVLLLFLSIRRRRFQFYQVFVDTGQLRCQLYQAFPHILQFIKPGASSSQSVLLALDSRAIFLVSFTECFWVFGRSYANYASCLLTLANLDVHFAWCF